MPNWFKSILDYITTEGGLIAGGPVAFSAVVLMTLAIATWWRRISTGRRHPRTLALQQEIPSFEHILPNAELLLSYAATAGKSLNDADVKILTDEITKYKTTDKESYENSGHNYATILSAYTRVAKHLLPMTAITLCECSVDARQTLRHHTWIGTRGVIFVLFVSFFAFVSSSISDSLKTEIDLANNNIITLRANLGSPKQSQPNKFKSPTG
jgi:hypothetical protein